jgi:hypothetical protein
VSKDERLTELVETADASLTAIRDYILEHGCRDGERRMRRLLETHVPIPKGVVRVAAIKRSARKARHTAANLGRPRKGKEV